MTKQKQSLIDFLEKAIELEQTVYIQQKLENKLYDHIESLGIPHNIPYPSEQHSSMKQCFEMSSSGGLFLGMIIGGISGFFGVSGLFSLIINVIFSGLGGIIIGGIIGTALTPVWYFIGYALAGARLKAAMAERAQKVSRDQERVRREKEQAERLSVVLAQLRSQLRASKEMLSRYYSRGPVYADYQNIVAVCSFYQYLKAGKCDTLKGHEGAYNIYDLERRLDQINDKLDRIIEDLSQIKRNQVMLYTTLQEGNRKIDTLITQSVKQTAMLKAGVEQNEIIAYNSEVARRELELANWLKTYELTKKGW